MGQGQFYAARSAVPLFAVLVLLGLSVTMAGCGGDPNPYRNECRSESCAVDLVVPPPSVEEAVLRLQ